MSLEDWRQRALVVPQSRRRSPSRREERPSVEDKKEFPQGIGGVHLRAQCSKAGTPSLFHLAIQALSRFTRWRPGAQTPPVKATGGIGLGRLAYTSFSFID